MNLCQPTTRRRNAATTRQSIVQAAHRRFLDQSYDTVGLREIAHLTQVSMWP
jgi:AcrR family transcriptional regulator